MEVEPCEERHPIDYNYLKDKFKITHERLMSFCSLSNVQKLIGPKINQELDFFFKS